VKLFDGYRWGSNHCTQPKFLTLDPRGGSASFLGSGSRCTTLISGNLFETGEVVRRVQMGVQLLHGPPARARGAVRFRAKREHCKTFPLSLFITHTHTHTHTPSLSVFLALARNRTLTLQLLHGPPARARGTLPPSPSLSPSLSLLLSISLSHTHTHTKTHTNFLCPFLPLSLPPKEKIDDDDDDGRC